MKYLRIFLLFGFFVTPLQGVNQKAIGVCKEPPQVQENIKRPFKPDEPEKLRTVTKVPCPCPGDETRMIGGGVLGKCVLNYDDPETWFVKVFHPYDDKPRQYILYTHCDNTNQGGSKSKIAGGNVIEGNFKKCRIERRNDNLILICSETRKWKKLGGAVILTKFLQVTESEKPRENFLKKLLNKYSF